MKKKVKQGIFLRYISLFMLFLVLTIPFFSANALAVSITGVTITGSDGIENVMQSDNDYFIATVEVSEEIDSNQLYISYTKEEAFDSCSGTTCTYTSSQTDRAGQEIPYIITLIENDVVADEASGIILVDEEEPTIEDYSVERTGDDITIEYEIEDTACEDCSGCSGIDYLTLYQDETEIEHINVASQCLYEDTLETSVSELNLEDGDHELCLVAVDNVGHTSDDACAVISVDTEGPHFETGSLQIVSVETRTPVQYIGTDAVLSTIIVNVTDPSLNENTVTADFSNLNAIIGNTYANITAHSCVQNNDDETLYTCTWNNIYIEDVSGTISLQFYAQDNEGNEGKYSLTWTLIKDETSPVVVHVYTASSQESNDIYLKSGTNSLYADLDPTGSAFSFENVEMDFGLASISNMEATTCWENGSYWTCIWNFTMSYSGTTSSTLTLTGEDDAGNALEEYNVNVQTDSSEPEILSITTSLDCPTATDTLIIEVNATDDSDSLFLTFYGDDVRTNNDPIIEDCINLGEDLFTCTLSVDDLVSYPEDEDVEIEVSDLAGNIADDEVDVSVCELEESGTPNLVTLSIGDFAAVDKLTLSYIDYPLYVPVTFSIVSGAHIVGKTASCENVGNVYFIDQSEREAFMVVTLPAQSVGNATFSLAVDCSVYLTMQYGDSVYVNPEIEEVPLEVELYGTPLGSIESSIEGIIALQKIGIAEAQAKIDNKVKWNRYLGWMCKIADTLNKINAVIAGIRTIMSVIGNAVYNCSLPLSPTAVVCQPIFQLSVSVNVFANKFNRIITTFVWPPGGAVGIINSATNPLNVFGVIIKTGCLLYSGKFCEGFNGLQNEIWIKADEAGQQAYYNSYLGGTGTYETTVPSAENPGHYRLFYDWDPYKSIHTARSCLYLDATIYNLRKERQINCMYTTCLEENAKNGLPIDICDVQFKERQCLYVDGAAWNAAGSKTKWGHSFQLLLNTIFSNLDIWVYSIPYYRNPICGKYLKTIHLLDSEDQIGGYEADPLFMLLHSGCHVWGSALTLTETNWFTSTLDWDFQANLEGTDYCVGY